MPDKWSNSFFYGHWYTICGPTDSAASPECFKNDPIPSLMATATLPTTLIILLLPLNAWQMIQFLPLLPLLLYQLWCFSWMPDKWYTIPSPMATATLLATLLNSAAAASPECLNKQCLNFFIYIYCFSTYGPTHSAAPPESLNNASPSSFTSTASLLTALLTLLLPMNALAIS